MTTAIGLVLLGILCRLSPHAHNLVPIGALALYAGAKLPKRWAFPVPLAALVLSNLAIGRLRPEFAPRWDFTELSCYVCYAVYVLLARLPKRDAETPTPTWVGLAFVGSIVFFLVTNLAYWVQSMPKDVGRAQTLFACYVDALPFYRNTFLAEMIGATTLFGLDALATRAAERRKLKPIPIEVEV